jgi:hypothetical protein
MSSKGSDDDEKLPNRPVSVHEGDKWIDVPDATPIRAEDSEPGQLRPRWRLSAEQTGWDLTFRIAVVVEKAEG